MFSRDEYESRRRRLLQMMETEKLDAVILYASKPESGYVRYYTGFESNLAIMDCSFLAVTPGRAVEWTLLTNAFWEEHGEDSGIGDPVITGDFPRAIGGLIPKQARRIGVAPLRQFPADSYAAIRNAAPDAEVADVKPQMLHLRAVKSPAEIALLRQIAGIADRGVEAFTRAARPGATEQAIAAEVEYALRRAGSGPFIFSTLVAAGPRTGRFIALPKPQAVEPGDIVQLDCGPSLNGYHGDVSRVLCAGEPLPEVRRLLEATALMYEHCLESLRPGRTASEIAREVLDAAQKLGYGPESYYQSPNVKAGFVGHGIGLGNPDAPQLSTEDHTVLEAGMVINIETILKDPEFGAARMEDAVELRAGGAVRLSQAPIRVKSESL